MPDETLTEKLARSHNALRFEQIPSDVVDAAKLHILDSLGCLLAGSRLEPGRLAYDFAVATSGTATHSTTTLLGSNRRVSYVDAVQAMSVAAHCGEMDDIHTGAGTCIGAMIIPALVALAEQYAGSGRRFIEAAIAGYETVARIGLSVDAPKLFARGWWPSTICGAFGVAAAGAKFLNWSEDAIANALGIASLHAGGMLTGGNEGASARHLAFGRAAQNGMLALLAAEQGFTGPKRALEDPRGFCLTLCSEPRWEFLHDNERFHLADVAFKPYPCARQLHAGVEALLTLLRQHAISPETIEAIELFVPTANAGMVNRPSITASHAATVGSGQYIMAVTAFRGRIDLASFEDEFLHNVEVRQLVNRVKVTGSSDLDRHYPKYWSGRIMVRLAGGQSVTHEVIIPKGESGNPMSRDEVEEKFLSLAAPILTEEKAQSVVREVCSLDARDSLMPLLAALKASS
ncbi:MAG TPA: MmgE/PrpD family protein [Candidatus Binatia bacterium]|jgi:2-methylcitrate dehydratase PrpD|nr:MmgE/PrpD family protein [Candidatus Binatia bacterium]